MYRKLNLMFLALVAACGTTGGAGRPGPPDPHDVQASAPGEAQCFTTSPAENAYGAQETNAVRARRGLAPLAPDPLIARVAAEHACDMARRGLMTHGGSHSSGPGERVKARGYRPVLTAENIAAGPYDLNRVLHEWEISPMHLANMLYPQQRGFGIGRAIGSDGRTVFWSAVYAAPK